jgi:hypothetical protein
MLEVRSDSGSTEEGASQCPGGFLRQARALSLASRTTMIENADSPTLRRSRTTATAWRRRPRSRAAGKRILELQGRERRSDSRRTTRRFGVSAVSSARLELAYNAIARKVRKSLLRAKSGNRFVIDPADRTPAATLNMSITRPSSNANLTVVKLSLLCRNRHIRRAYKRVRRAIAAAGFDHC